MRRKGEKQKQGEKIVFAQLMSYPTEYGAITYNTGRKEFSNLRRSLETRYTGCVRGRFLFDGGWGRGVDIFSGADHKLSYQGGCIRPRSSVYGSRVATLAKRGWRTPGLRNSGVVS